MKNQLNTKRFFNAMAFVALVIAGIALMISKIFFGANGTISRILNSVAYTLAFVVTAFCAYFYVRTRRNVAWLIIYIIAVIIVVVPLVLSMFNI